MMRRLFFWAMCCMASVSVWGAAGDYTWEATRTRMSLSEEEAAMPELVLLSHVRYEYTFENNEFLMYTTHHRIIYVNSNEAIGRNNRIYISMNNTMDLKSLKARSINKAGKVVMFDESNLKEIKEEETGNAYRIFAIEGVEIGSEIEYYYVRKMVADVFNGEYIQFGVPSKNLSLLLSSPKHLQFDFRSYNGLPDVVKLADTTQNVYEMKVDAVPALKEEQFAYPKASRKKVEYKLAYNRARSNGRLNTWDDAARRFNEILTKLSKDDEKALDKFVKSTKISPSLSAEEKIKKLEEVVKLTIKVDEERRDEALSAVESIVKFRVASKEGITRLLVNAYEKLGVNVQPVLTCSRERAHFDPGFDTWSFLDEYFLYFPETKGFIAPYFPTRYPLIPAEYMAQYGLFVKPITAGGINSAVGQVKEIPAASYLANQDNLDIEVRFDNALEHNIVNQVRKFTGYNAMFLAPFYEVANDQQRKEMLEGLIKDTAPDQQMMKYSAAKATRDGHDWFDVTTEFKTAAFLEKAGPRTLFKVGLLIGPQVEMYRDDKRTLAVENTNNRTYDRKIRIHLPAGYTVKNVEQLKFDVRYNQEGNNPYIFKSDFTLSGDVLEIVISEFYKEINCPVERYEDFRKVVNASADFNKVTLVLEKGR